MTLAVRNRLVLFATIVAAIISFATIFIAILVLIKTPSSFSVGDRVLLGLCQLHLFAYSFYASIISVVFLPIFSFVCLIVIYLSFEKTQSIEITFFAAALFAISFEGLRILIPFYELWEPTLFYASTITRIVLASRIFLCIAVFSSGMFTTGATSGQLGSALFLEAFISIALAKIVPLNTHSLSSNFLITLGYSHILFAVFLSMVILTIIIFYILAKTRGILEYQGVAKGLFFFFTGYFFLTNSDAWLILVTSILIFIIGTRKIIKKIHAYHLWL